PSMSIHEEVTRAAITVLMPVFNNIVLFNQHKERNTIDTIVPDLAESWTWSENGKELTFKLRQGVKWHCGPNLDTTPNDIIGRIERLQWREACQCLFDPRPRS